jgi:hypothetical protein
MMHRIRVVLDTEEDVIRDVKISSTEKLFTLHQSIIKAFNLSEGEMASFYISNDDWEQGEEISLLDFGSTPGREAKQMDNTLVQKALPDTGGKMIYVYDFLNLWTFYIEVLDIEDKDGDLEIHEIVGQRPDTAPPKEMESMEDELDSDYGSESDPDFDMEDEGLFFDMNLN